jgi:ATP-dependent helicase HrpB
LHHPLPIDASLAAIRATLRERGALLLRAETGAGKTTRVAPALLADVPGRVLLVEPRRMAARAAAERIASELGGKIGDEVGYRVRFERRESARTRLTCLTDGMMVAWLQADPFLEGVDVVVFDEAHERSLAGDLALAMVARVRRQVRPELQIVVMSATVEPEPYVSFLDAASIDVPGRTFPVAIELAERPDPRPPAPRMVAAIRAELARDDGDVLAFLPGRGEIAATAAALGDPAGFDVRELHGELPLDRQLLAIRRGSRRRVVLATNVAETSVTVEGVAAVVDSTLVRIARHDPARDLPRLDLIGASRAALDQRAGRAGRERPGRCVRLATAAELALRPVAETPAVRRLDPTPAILELLAWGETDLEHFPWLEAPPAGALARAQETLRELGALDREGRLTAGGKLLARLPLPPRLGRFALECWQLGYGVEAARLAALLEDRDLAPEWSGSGSRSDLLDRLEVLRREQARRNPRAGRIEAAAREIERVLAPATGEPPTPDLELEEAVGRALLAAWPGRLARRRAARSYQLAGGRGARLAETSGLIDAPLIVALDLVDRGSDASIRMAAVVEESWLDSASIVEETQVAIDPAGGRVLGRRVRRVGSLVLDQREVPVTAADAELALLEAVRADPAGTTAWHSDPELVALAARLEVIAAMHAELEVPSLESLVIEAAPSVLDGARTLGEVSSRPWARVLPGLLSRQIRSALERDAPTELRLPSGRAARISWTLGAPPVLASRIQDFFGLDDTPKLGSGAVPLVVHLLAPNGRPQQVTTDLASFWRETYPQVRRELRGRYPKHAWPEDPASAVPKEGTQQRRRG